MVINGNKGRVKYVEGNIIFLESPTGVLPVFPVFSKGVAYYPILPGYASTGHKIIDQYLEHNTGVSLKSFVLSLGYIVLSRVSSLDKVVPMLQLRRTYFFDDL